MKHILLTEDDFDFSDILKHYLELAGFKVTCCFNGQEALHFLKSAKSAKIDMCILDVMMPIMDGFTLAAEVIQMFPEMPFIFLTARNQKEDKLKGLKLGADDYVVKPFEADELMLRIRNILKRSEPSISKVISELISVGSYSFDYKNLQLTLGDNYTRLTEKEAMLLLYFTQNPNRIIKREEILLYIWKSDDYFSGRSLDVFVSRLRKYLAKDLRIEIETIRGMGFVFHLG